MAKVIYWAARAVAICGILFISAFALDVFTPKRPMIEVAGALFMHLIPSYVLVALLALAWRFELVGGIAYLLICILPFAVLPNPVWVNAMLAAPFALAGVLFVLSHLLPRRGAKVANT